MEFDVLIIGSGLSSFYLSLKLPKNLKVGITTKADLTDCNSRMAQGGIASVSATSDSFDSHITDTLTAGAGLSDRDVVQEMIEDGPKRIKDLQDFGVAFDVDESGKTHLGLEGGHSARRVLHVQDHSGEAIHNTLLQKVKAQKNITLLDHHCAVDLITNKKLRLKPSANIQCFGAYMLDTKTDHVFAVKAKTTVLATGGAGKVYLYTSNWDGATGDGIAMAFRAGCRVSNLEFMQFHPTCLYHKETRNFLITEAIRGEGGRLINKDGKDFTSSQHKLGALAPRDIVARMIDEEMKTSGAKCVYLDISHKSPDFIQNHFPVIFERCLSLGIDIRKEPIPVVPAAHYLCGGVLTDTQGVTDIKGLLAIGETACTGLHGANRLASNSLLECLVQGGKAAEYITKFIETEDITNVNIPDWIHSTKQDRDELSVINHIWDEIRNLMWNYVGIVRSNKRLERAEQRLLHINSEVKDYYWDFKVQKDILELRNIALVAKLTVLCAQKRKESRGIHFNIDYPELSQRFAKNTVIQNSII
ncbi:MAG: L-aspartate oxidase [Bdellovibrionales bacterium]|nr:L-aspartate oxidase [Bdellovibrionales bacterium]